MPFRAALGTPYIYNSLAQEKTGDFWVNGRLFGKQTCHLTEDIEESDYVLIIGANPWQSHGFPRARKVLQELSQGPAPHPGGGRSAAHPYRRDGRRPSAGAAGHRRLPDGGDARHDRPGGARGRRLPGRPHGRLRRAAGDPAAGAGGRVRPAGRHRAGRGALGGARLRRRRQRLQPARPGRRAFAAQHAQHLSREAPAAGDRQLRQDRRQQPAHPVRPADRPLQGARRGRRHDPRHRHARDQQAVPAQHPAGRDRDRPARPGAGAGGRQRQPAADRGRHRRLPAGLRQAGAARGDRRRRDRDRRAGRLRAAGLVAVREVGGDLLHPGLSHQPLPSAAADPASRPATPCPSPRSTTG